MLYNDDWDVCPKCIQNKHSALGKLLKKIDTAYGKVKQDVYNKMVAESDALKVSLNSKFKITMKEIVKCGINRDTNTFEVNYSFSCDVCNFYYEYKNEVKLELQMDTQIINKEDANIKILPPMVELTLKIQEINFDDEWWRSDTQKSLEAVAIKLIKKGFTIDEAVGIIESVDSITSEEFGGQ